MHCFVQHLSRLWFHFEGITDIGIMVRFSNVHMLEEFTRNINPLAGVNKAGCSHPMALILGVTQTADSTLR